MEMLLEQADNSTYMFDLRKLIGIWMNNCGPIIESLISFLSVLQTNIVLINGLCDCSKIGAIYSPKLLERTKKKHRGHIQYAATHNKTLLCITGASAPAPAQP